MKEKLWAVEFNFKQDSPHIEPLEKYLEDSRSKVLSKLDQDWMLIDIAKSQEEAIKIADFSKDVIRKSA